MAGRLRSGGRLAVGRLRSGGRLLAGRLRSVGNLRAGRLRSVGNLRAGRLGSRKLPLAAPDFGLGLEGTCVFGGPGLEVLGRFGSGLDSFWVSGISFWVDMVGVSGTNWG